MYTYINSVTTGQVGIKCHLSDKIQKVIFLDQLATSKDEQDIWAQQNGGNIGIHWRK